MIIIWGTDSLNTETIGVYIFDWSSTAAAATPPTPSTDDGWTILIPNLSIGR